MKKRRIAAVCIVLAVTLLLIFCLQTAKPIGTVSGAEYEYLTIGDCQYEKAENAPVSRADKGEFLGIATNGDARFRIYAVKGYKDYLYCKWQWEGWIYRLK